MSPLLNRIYTSTGGSELLDMLMKYLYKGMAASAVNAGAGKGITPQSTGGFSQIGARPGQGDGSGSGMSVLLSWHEKVRESSVDAGQARGTPDKGRGGGNPWISKALYASGAAVSDARRSSAMTGGNA